MFKKKRASLSLLYSGFSLLNAFPSCYSSAIPSSGFRALLSSFFVSPSFLRLACLQGTLPYVRWFERSRHMYTREGVFVLDVLDPRFTISSFLEAAFQCVLPFFSLSLSS